MNKPICPECGHEAVQTTRRDLSGNSHEVTGLCAKAHLWVTKWFAADEPKGAA